MVCLENWKFPDGETGAKFGGWVILSENQTIDRTMVGNWFRGTNTIYGSVLSVWILLVNVAVLVVKKTDQDVLYRCSASVANRNVSWLAVNFSVVQLVIGVVIIPITLVTDSREAWIFGLVPCRLWLTIQVILVASTFWSLAVLTADRVLHQMSLGLHYRKTKGTFAPVIVIFLVWFLSGIAVLPLFVSFQREDFVLEEVCAISMTRDDAAAFFISAFLFPVSVIAAGSAAILLAKLRAAVARGGESIQPSSKAVCTQNALAANNELTIETSIENDGTLSAILMINLCSFVTWSPSFIVNTLVPFCDGMCIDPGLWNLLLWVGYSNAGLSPCLWALDAQIRDGYRSLLKRLVCRCYLKSRNADAETKKNRANSESLLNHHDVFSHSVDAILLAETGSLVLDERINKNRS